MSQFGLMTTMYNVTALVYLNLTMVFQMINFLILLWLLKRWLYKPLLEYMDNRREEIKRSLDDAAMSREEAEKELEKIRIEYEKAQRDSFAIRDQARNIAEQERERIVLSGKDEYQEIIDKARRDMDFELEHTRENLRQSVGELSVKIARMVLQEDLTEEQRKKATSDYLDAAGKL